MKESVKVSVAWKVWVLCRKIRLPEGVAAVADEAAGGVVAARGVGAAGEVAAAGGVVTAGGVVADEAAGVIWVMLMVVTGTGRSHEEMAEDKLEATSLT